MKRLGAYKTVLKQATDRLYIGFKYPTTSLIGILIIGVLSVLFVFTFPHPIRPRTSIGFMNVLAFVLLVVTVFIKGKRFSLLRFSDWQPLDYSVMFYAFAVLMSLVVTQTIQDFTPIRLLLTGVALYWTAQEIRPSQYQKRIVVHVFGSVAVLIAALSLLQIVIPDVMNAFAESYLRGRAAYGISIEFDRGRLLHWGMLVFIFPFFYSSTLLMSWKNRIWASLYVLLGYAGIFGSLVIANFRWTFMVFILVSGWYFFRAKSWNLITGRKLMYLGIMSVFVVLSGLTVARVVLGYNLLDRFLLKNAYRDISESLGRITLYDQALTVFQSYPLFGAGYGNYYSVVWPFPHMQYFSIFDQFEPIPVPIAAHNEYYTVLAETGITGLIGFMFIMYLIGKHLYVIIYRDALSTIDRLFYLSFAGSYIAMCLYVLFENMYPQNIVYLLLMGSAVRFWVVPASDHA